MNTRAGFPPMAKSKKSGDPQKSGEPKRGRPRRPDGNGLPVRIDADLVKRARAIASSKGISLTSYVSDLLRGPIGRDFLQVMKELEAES